jgi:DNA repair protein RadA/Sms
MLLAVLERRAGFKLISKDVFLNIAGGIRVDDPAIDLAVLSAILSSNFDIPIDPSVCFSGEVGLTGEIRPVTRIEQRIEEAQKLGFKEIYIPKFTRGVNLKKFKIQIHSYGRVEDVFREIFSKKGMEKS